MDNRKLLFQMGWNMSLTNHNIWAGTASKDSLDLLLDTLSDGKLMGSYDVSAIGDFIDAYSDFAKFSHSSNSLSDTTFTLIGINACFGPQSSEH